MWPALTVSMVEIQLSRVVLPEPEAPMIPKNSPSSTVKLMSRMALVMPPSLP